MIVHSSRVELAGLVHDLLRDRDLADVVEERGELQVAPPLVAQPELLSDGKRKLDHVSGVLAGVVIVALDDVAEHERGPAVGAVELEQSAQAVTALVREDREQAEHRHEVQDLGRGVMKVLSDHESDARQRRVDRVYDPALAKRGAQVHRAGDHVPERRDQKIDGELRHERRDQEDRAGGPRLDAGDREHRDRPDREPRVRDHDQHPARPRARPGPSGRFERSRTRPRPLAARARAGSRTAAARTPSGSAPCSRSGSGTRRAWRARARART